MLPPITPSHIGKASSRAANKREITRAEQRLCVSNRASKSQILIRTLNNKIINEVAYIRPLTGKLCSFTKYRTLL
jgi:hypothetical protein